MYKVVQTAGYPSDLIELNVSKDTTVKEIITIKGMSEDDFKPLNISLTFGPVSHFEYCINMLNFPTFGELDEFFKSELNKVTA